MGSDFRGVREICLCTRGKWQQSMARKGGRDSEMLPSISMWTGADRTDFKRAIDGSDLYAFRFDSSPLCRDDRPNRPARQGVAR